MDKKRRYDVFLLAFGGLFAAGCVWVGLCPSAWALALAPVLGALGAAASWCALARFALCRNEALLEKSFTRPLKLFLCPLLWALYTLALLALAPAAPESQADLEAALAVLAGLGGVIAAPVVLIGCAAAALVTGAKHMKASEGRHPLYREGPFALALIWVIGLAGLLIAGGFYLLV